MKITIRTHRERGMNNIKLEYVEVAIYIDPNSLVPVYFRLDIEHLEMVRINRGKVYSEKANPIEVVTFLKFISTYYETYFPGEIFYRNKLRALVKFIFFNKERMIRKWKSEKKRNKKEIEKQTMYLKKINIGNF